jgi:RNA 2',3'-cyclic 3'-phosphodiesterase
MSHRLFVAFVPPRAERDALRPLLGGVENARWQRDDLIHITLRFIGNVDRPQAEDIAAALGQIRAEPLTLAMTGVGQFRRRDRLEFVWAGLHPTEALTAMHAKVDRALVSAGVAPDARAYHPHVTLGRFPSKTPRDAAESWLAANAGFTGKPFTLNWFGLYESVLGKSGPVYSLVERYDLK